MKKTLFTVLIMSGVLSVTLNAGEHKLTCTNVYSNSTETVKVEASSRSAALSKVKNDPAYSEYKNCS